MAVSIRVSQTFSTVAVAVVCKLYRVGLIDSVV
jgi:hypothetical protein